MSEQPPPAHPQALYRHRERILALAALGKAALSRFAAVKEVATLLGELILATLALLRGRRYVLPEDMTDLVPDVLRHRVVLSYEGLSEGLDSDALIAKIMKQIAPPARPLEHEKRAA